MHIIEFSPPCLCLEGSFNTFRLGVKYSRILNPGDKVALVFKPDLKIVGYAIVDEVIVGKLGEMALLHAALNHNQKLLPSEGAPERLINNVIKRYGPHMVNEGKKVTVIYLTTL